VGCNGKKESNWESYFSSSEETMHLTSAVLAENSFLSCGKGEIEEVLCHSSAYHHPIV